MKKINFSKDFLWGSAFSGPQTEASHFEDGKSATIWDYWYEKEKEIFFEQKNSVNDFYHRYMEDIAIAKKLNFNSLRPSIQWSRLIPDGKNINDKAVEFYTNMIDEMENNGIQCILNLFHFDMPMWAQEKGGWESREVVDAFVFYCETAFKLFGHKVKRIATFNEPIVPVEGGYLHQFHYPNIIDMKKAWQVQFNSLMAHHLAVKKFRELNIPNCEIGCILNITPAIPKSNSPEDLKASEYAELFQFRCFLDPMINGEYPQELIKLAKENNFMFDYLEGDFDLIKETKMDFLGINFYQPMRVQAKIGKKEDDDHLLPESFFSHYRPNDVIMNKDKDWEIYPKALYMALKNIQENYNNFPTYVSENGMGVSREDRFRDENGKIIDDYRIKFFRDHLYWINKAIEEGANVFGFHSWTYIDNWSWKNAYRNRYGFISLDIESLERTEKESANFIRDVISNNGFDYDENDTSIEVYEKLG